MKADATSESTIGHTHSHPNSNHPRRGHGVPWQKGETRRRQRKCAQLLTSGLRLASANSITRGSTQTITRSTGILAPRRSLPCRASLKAASASRCQSVSYARKTRAPRRTLGSRTTRTLLSSTGQGAPSKRSAASQDRVAAPERPTTLHMAQGNPSGPSAVSRAFASSQLAS